MKTNIKTEIAEVTWLKALDGAQNLTPWTSNIPQMLFMKKHNR